MELPIYCQATSSNTCNLSAEKKCDHCSKTQSDLGLTYLKFCSRCKKAYYCSEHCQKEQWRKGHNQYCRKPGKFKPGDFVGAHWLPSLIVLGQVVESAGSSLTVKAMNDDGKENCQNFLFRQDPFVASPKVVLTMHLRTTMRVVQQQYQ